MKKYIIPELTVEAVTCEDIVTLSVADSKYGVRTTWDDLFGADIYG